MESVINNSRTVEFFITESPVAVCAFCGDKLYTYKEPRGVMFSDKTALCPDCLEKCVLYVVENLKEKP